MIEIDATKCTRCGFCSDECPVGLFALQSAPDGSRVMRVGSIDYCTRCGHCVAICPEDAIVHGELPQDGFKARTAVISPDVMRDFLLLRRSIRTFKEKPVPREVVEQLIEVGTHAGTATNAQTEGFIVIQEREVLSGLEQMVLDILWDNLKPLGSSMGRKLARIKFGDEMAKQSILYYKWFKIKRDNDQLKGTVFRNAPAVIAIHGKRSNTLAHENCAIATRNIEILANSLGLGACWAGLLLVAAGYTGKIAHYVGIPDDRNIYSAIMLGYPKHEYKKTIPRREREIRWL